MSNKEDTDCILWRGKQSSLL